VMFLLTFAVTFVVFTLLASISESDSPFLALIGRSISSLIETIIQYVIVFGFYRIGTFVYALSSSSRK
jgi:hypothetical protein